MKLKNLAEPYEIKNGSNFRLKKFKPRDTGPISVKKDAEKLLEKGRSELTELQEVLFAQDRWSVLLIFQAMDAAGKDSTVKHVMSGINPQGCQVYSFKAPSPEEIDHDFLWRAACRLPERGRIGIFNRSYYEETLVVRVHPEFLDSQKLPSVCLPKNMDDLWKTRFQSINDFERHLARNGTLVLKFFLHVSQQEQARRFLSRLEEPAKYWKFSAADLEERKRWDSYMHAYEEMIRHTSTEFGRWYVVPADHKWYARLVVSSAITGALNKLNLRYPAVSPQRVNELKMLKTRLQREIK